MASAPPVRRSIDANANTSRYYLHSAGGRRSLYGGPSAWRLGIAGLRDPTGAALGPDIPWEGVANEYRNRDLGKGRRAAGERLCAVSRRAERIVPASAGNLYRQEPGCARLDVADPARLHDARRLLPDGGRGDGKQEAHPLA